MFDKRNYTDSRRLENCDVQFSSIKKSLEMPQIEEDRNKNSPKDADNMKENNRNNVHRFDIAPDVSLKHPSIVRLTEHLVIPAHHGCKLNVEVDSRLPSGTVICEPLNNLDGGLTITPTIVKLRKQTNKYNRSIVVSIFNDYPIPQTIKKNTPIVNLAFLEKIVCVVSKAPKNKDNIRKNIVHGNMKGEMKKEGSRKIFSVLETHGSNSSSGKLVCPKLKIEEFLEKYENIFATVDEPLQVTTRVTHEIVTDSSPIAKAPYRIPISKKKIYEEKIEEMLRDKIIQPSNSPWSAPVVLVEQKTDYGIKHRLCVDFRGLNKVTKKDYFPIPNIHETLDSLGGAELFSKLDLKSGYWQVEVHPRDREKTAFSVPWGHYECNRMVWSTLLQHGNA